MSRYPNKVLLTYKVVRDRSHPLVGEDYPNDDEVASSCHNDHAAKQDTPQELAPPWQYEHICLGKAVITGKTLE